MAEQDTKRDETGGEAPPGRDRRGRRLQIHGVLVAIDAPDVADAHWVVDAIDLSSAGMGLVLPPELPEGSEVELTFRLADDVELARVPARVTHRLGSSGGVRFTEWPPEHRLRFLEYLVGRYEGER